MERRDPESVRFRAGSGVRVRKREAWIVDARDVSAGSGVRSGRSECVRVARDVSTVAVGVARDLPTDTTVAGAATCIGVTDATEARIAASVSPPVDPVVGAAGPGVLPRRSALPAVGRRKVLAFPADPEVVQKILSHLGLETAPPALAPARMGRETSD